MDILERLRKLPAIIAGRNAAQEIYEVSEDAISEIERLREALQEAVEDGVGWYDKAVAALKGDE